MLLAARGAQRAAGASWSVGKEAGECDERHKWTTGEGPAETGRGQPAAEAETEVSLCH